MGLTLAYGGLFFDRELKLFQKYRHLAYYGKNKHIRKKNIKKAIEIGEIARYRRHIEKLIQSGHGCIYSYL